MSGVGVFAEEQIELRKTVAQLLAKRADAAALRKTLESGEAFDRGLWDVLCQQVGVAALAIPRSSAGSARPSSSSTWCSRNSAPR